MTDVSNFMDASASDFDAPQPLPKGRYSLTVRNYESGVIPNEKATPYVKVLFAVSALIDGEDTQDEISSAGDVENMFWMTDKSAYRTKEWLRDIVGLDVEDRPFRELFEEAIGATVIAEIDHELRGKNKDFLVPVVTEFLAA